VVAVGRWACPLRPDGPAPCPGRRHGTDTAMPRCSPRTGGCNCCTPNQHPGLSKRGRASRGRPCLIRAGPSATLPAAGRGRGEAKKKAQGLPGCTARALELGGPSPTGATPHDGTGWPGLSVGARLAPIHRPKTWRRPRVPGRRCWTGGPGWPHGLGDQVPTMSLLGRAARASVGSVSSPKRNRAATGVFGRL